jgi:hypothetical protein
MLGGSWDDVSLFWGLVAEQSLAGENIPSQRIVSKGRMTNDVQEIPLFMKVTDFLREQGCIPSYFSYDRVFPHQIPFAWDKLPLSTTPNAACLPSKRVPRKAIQIENLIKISELFISHLLRFEEDVRVVEFCAGSGFVCLPLAAMFPSVKFILLDRKSGSIDIGLLPSYSSHYPNCSCI